MVRWKLLKMTSLSMPSEAPRPSTMVSVTKPLRFNVLKMATGSFVESSMPRFMAVGKAVGGRRQTA